jgi:sugar lactone lactonase YvrE
MTKFSVFLLMLLFTAAPLYSGHPESGRLVEIASSEQQWTGVAVSREGRIFVNFPRWSEKIPMSVGEIQKNGSVAPYPDQDVNDWSKRKDARKYFICVQSVYIDRQNYLWVLDAAAPKMGKVIKSGPKLMKINLETDKVLQIYPLSEVTRKKSYLNDVRILSDEKTAFITDSGTGGIIILNLNTGEARRILDDNSSVKSEGREVIIDGKKWRRNGRKPDVHSDGLALSKDETFLYYHSLTATRLYRIPVQLLTNPKVTGEQIVDRIEYVTDTGPADGLLTGAGSSILLTDLENKAVSRVTADKRLETVVQDSVLEWPDSLAEGPDGQIYVTTSRIHEGSKPRGAYQLFAFSIKN